MSKEQAAAAAAEETTGKPCTASPEELKAGMAEARGAREGEAEVRPTRLKDALPVPTRISLRGVSVELNELTLEDLAELDAAGYDPAEIAIRIQAGGIASIRHVLWLLLRQTDPELTLHDVGRLVPFKALAEIGQGGLVDTLLSIAFPPDPAPNA